MNRINSGTTNRTQLVRTAGWILHGLGIIREQDRASIFSSAASAASEEPCKAAVYCPATGTTHAV